MYPYVHLRMSKDNLPGGNNVSLYHWAHDHRIRSKTHSLEKLGLKNYEKLATGEEDNIDNHLTLVIYQKTAMTS